MYAKCETMHKAQEFFDKMHDVDIVSWNVMIVEYAKNGYIERAHELFIKIPHLNEISLTIMITGYAQNGFSKNALENFKHMQFLDVKLDYAIFASILPACTTMGVLEEGIEIHKRVVKNGFTSNVMVVNALIYIYEKYGSIEKEYELFDKMHACRHNFEDYNDRRICTRWVF